MPISVYGLASTDAQVNVVVETLKTAVFIQDDISILFPYRRRSPNIAREKKAKVPVGAAAGGMTGQVVGGALGRTMGIKVVPIPGVGPFLAAGPILAALSGVTISAAIGGLAGTLMGLGLGDHDAKNYEGKIRDGSFLISIHAQNNVWAGKARTIFEAAGLENVGSSHEAAASAVLPVGKRFAKSRNAVVSSPKTI